jgi:hypothetical protein
MPQSATLAIDLRILDIEDIRRHAEDVDPEYGSTDGEAIAAAVCNPQTPPLDTGFEITSASVLITETNARLTIACTILDEDAVVTEARARYGACWGPVGEAEWNPQSIHEALYEILVASNASPSPDVCGFEIATYRAMDQEHDAPAL